MRVFFSSLLFSSLLFSSLLFSSLLFSSLLLLQSHSISPSSNLPSGGLSRIATAQLFNRAGHHFIMSVKADNEATLYTNFLHRVKSVRNGSNYALVHRQMGALTWRAPAKKSGVKKVN